nr:hypothetical protein [Tanacetum cinerariifolium]
ADSRRSGRCRARRDPRGLHQPACAGRRRRIGALRPQPAGLHEAAVRQGRSAAHQPGRRHCCRVPDVPRRPSHPQERLRIKQWKS